MHRAIPVHDRIRNLFGDRNSTKISVPADKTLNNSWNEQLAQFQEYYDAVTIHDYTACSHLKGLRPQQQLSLLASYGRAALPVWISNVRDTFMSDKRIFMTEYNTGCSNATFGYSVLHAMFAVSYMSAAICDETESVELLMWHLYGQQSPANQWGTFDVVTSFSDKADDVEGATFNVVAQILAQIGYIGLVRNDQMSCLEFAGTECPVLGFKVMGNDAVQCLFGIGFNDEKEVDSFGFVVVNACDHETMMDLDLSGMRSGNDSAKLNVYQYHSHDGGNMAKFSDCNGGNIWDNGCAAVHGDYRVVDIVSGAVELNLEIDALSVVLAYT